MRNSSSKANRILHGITTLQPFPLILYVVGNAISVARQSEVEYLLNFKIPRTSFQPRSVIFFCAAGPRGDHRHPWQDDTTR